MMNNKIKKLKLILTDVDGVLTDGSLYFTKSGEYLKKFNIKDGMGVNILLRNNIPTGIVTKERSKIVETWAKQMNISFIKMGVKQKEKALDMICKKFSLKKSEVAYIGDDVNDLSILNKVGVSACPSDSVKAVKDTVNYICKNRSGDGAFREFCDLILKIKFGKKTILY